MSRVIACLAAGQGKRMGRLSSYLQKSMYPVNGRPFVAYTVDQLATAAKKENDTELVFVIGHHGEQVMAYFGDEYAGLQVSYIWQETRRGTADAVRLVLEQRRSAESVIGWLGDSFFPVRAFGQIDRTEHEMVITAFRDKGDECARHRLDLHRDGRVLKAWRGTGPYIESGLWRVSRDFLEYLNPTQDGEYRMLPALDGYIQSGGTVGYIELPHRLHLENESSLDDSRLIEAMELFSTGKP